MPTSRSRDLGNSSPGAPSPCRQIIRSCTWSIAISRHTSPAARATNHEESEDDEVGGGARSLTPGFRIHMGGNWYALGGVEVPVTQPEPFDYQVLGGLMKDW